MVDPTAIIYDNVVLGQNVTIGPYCVIGGRGFHKNSENESEICDVIIGDNTIIGSHVTINAGVEKDTVIGQNCKIMNHVNIGHDSVIAHNCIISASSCLAGFTTVESYCNLGVGTVVKNRVNVRQGCMIGMGSVVTQDTLYWAVYRGVPAKPKGFNSIGAERYNVEDAEEKFASW